MLQVIFHDAQRTLHFTHGHWACSFQNNLSSLGNMQECCHRRIYLGTSQVACSPTCCFYWLAEPGPASLGLGLNPWPHDHQSNILPPELTWLRNQPQISDYFSNHMWNHEMDNFVMKQICWMFAQITTNSGRWVMSHKVVLLYYELPAANDWW